MSEIKHEIVKKLGVLFSCTRISSGLDRGFMREL